MTPPTVLDVEPSGPVDAVVRPPGSKSITNRALLVAGLAAGRSRLFGALASEDTDAMAAVLDAVGVPVQRDVEPWLVTGAGGRLGRGPERLDARASGTTARFVTAALTLATGAHVVDGTPRMRRRPIGELVDALRALGAHIDELGRERCPPVRVHGTGLAGGPVLLDARRSSQFASAVMMVAPFARRPVTIRFVDDVVVSRPYLRTTAEVMAAFGADVDVAPDRVEIGLGGYRAVDFTVEADASAATYPLAAAAVTGGSVVVEGIPARSTQADLRFLDVLEAMGCRVDRTDVIRVKGPAGGRLRGVDVDMVDMPDAALTVAVLAAFADRPTTLTGLATLRIKETDRLAALEAELAKLGARATAGASTLTVEPTDAAESIPEPIHTYDDHRMAMAFAVAGLRMPGVRIEDPECVRKTWPEFFTMLSGLRARPG